MLRKERRQEIEGEGHFQSARHRIIQHPIAQITLQFVIGWSSGIIATVCVHPVDLIKVRLQLLSVESKSKAPSTLRMVSSLVQQGRGLELYDGLSTALLRQVMYGGSRLGLFFIFEDMLNHYGENKQLEVNFGHRVLAGLGAGAVASFIGCPAEVALIRMQADRLKPLDKRANYRSVFDALMRMARSGGILTFWTGAWPTIIRAMSTYLGQLAFFSEAKHRLKRHASMSDQARTTVASGIGGPMGAVLSSPLDLVKTRLENQPHESGVVRQYHGLMDCAVKVARTEGLLGFYKGFGPYLCRMAPHSMITLIVADSLRGILQLNDSI